MGLTDTGFLHRYFLNNRGKRLHKWVHYFDIYERHFERFRDRPIQMLEIGVSGGGSLEMWSAYFHPNSKIVGIDIDRACAQHAHGNISVHIGSQDDPEFLSEIVSTYGAFDIVLDDGSHVNSHVIKTLECLLPHVVADGVYLVEDMHASYWERFGGGLRQPDTFIEYAKDKIDELNSQHIGGDLPPTDITRSVDSISFYDSVVVFEKRPQGRRQDVVTKAM
ncbi:MAG: class I SAM-dependent methyltransferase [Pseudomonadota bacterium]